MLHKLKSYLKLCILIFGVSIFFINCEKENDFTNTQNEEVVKILYKQRTVKLSEIPDIKNYISTKIGEDVFSRTGEEFNQAIFDVDNILEVIDTLNNINYSLQFAYADTPIGEFYNLVVGKTPNGELKTPFVLKYKCDESQLETYIANDLNFSSFKGGLSLHKYTDFFELGAFSRGDDVCPPEYDEVGDPIPCDTQPIDGGISGGSSGSDDGVDSDGSDSSGDSNGSSSSSGGSNSGTCTWGTETTACVNHEPGGVCGGMETVLVLDCGDFFDEQRAQSSKDGDCPGCTPDNEGAIGIINLTSLFETWSNTLLDNLELSPNAIDFVNNFDNIVVVSSAYQYLEDNIINIDVDGNKSYEPEAINTASLRIELEVDKYKLLEIDCDQIQH